MKCHCPACGRSTEIDPTTLGFFARCVRCGALLKAQLQEEQGAAAVAVRVINPGRVRESQSSTGQIADLLSRPLPPKKTAAPMPPVHPPSNPSANPSPFPKCLTHKKIKSTKKTSTPFSPPPSPSPSPRSPTFRSPRNSLPSTDAAWLYVNASKCSAWSPSSASACPPSSPSAPSPSNPATFS